MSEYTWFWVLDGAFIVLMTSVLYFTIYYCVRDISLDD